mgnify:FL=1
MISKEISEKLKRFNHEIDHLHKNKEYNKNNLINLAKIEKRIRENKDPYDRDDVKLKKVLIDNTYPDYIFENIKKLSNYIA